MIVIAAVILGLLALYGWLSGNWFGRVLAFIALAPVCAFAVAWIVAATLAPDNQPGAMTLVALCGAAAAWPVSGVPIYMQRRRERENSAVLAMVITEGPADIY